MRNSIVGKILMALIFASMIGGISAGPALARNGDRGQGQRRSHAAITMIAAGNGIVDGVCIGPVATTTRDLLMAHRSTLSRFRRPASASFSPSRSTFDRGVLNVDPRLLSAAISVPPGAIGLERINARRLSRKAGG